MQWLDLPAWKVGDRGFELRSDIQVSKKENVSSPLTREHSILWEPSCARGSVFGLRPSGLEFRIMCLEGSVISLISTSSRFSTGPF